MTTRSPRWKRGLLGATLLSGAALLPAFAADTAAPPLAKDIYIRGSFNGWGTDNLLAYRGNGVYETTIQISPGNHAFKVGYKDWTAEWVIDPAANVSVAVDTAYKMDTHPGPEDYLFVKKTASFRFSVDVSNPSVPVLRVTRAPDVEAVAVDPHKDHAVSTTLNFATFDGKTESARFSVQDAAAPLRSYAQSSTMQLRDPGPQYVTYTERADLPTVRSGNLAFDALFALAGAEMKQDSVAQIKDGNYNGGGAIACDCFETGERWHYVWTRDLSYAATLGLAMLDPERVRNSLDFKLSGYRDGIVKAPTVAGSADGLQIIQDTGSGGSWPVSTDRVSWAFGAEEVLKTLPPDERKDFAARALKALTNTIENDRLAAFDSAVGLYNGEQSFLDWRDQTYAAWIVNDIASLASSKALSTNVAHYKALTLASDLAQEQGDLQRAKKYKAWAADLKKAINAKLWLDDAGMYSSLTAPHFDGAPLHKFDWLGEALAVITGVAERGRAEQILANYPHGPMGAPVIFPEQPGMPIYHNRAIWPFVTAYGLKAAAMKGNVSVADAAYDMLMRGAALNLSNMENLEWLSGQPLLLDEKNPSLIGPVINSKRQLWSVGAYLGMVIGNVFGVSTTDTGIRVAPFITTKLRRETFAGANEIVLHHLRMRGKDISVRIVLPPASATPGYYQLASIAVDGQAAAADIGWQQLAAQSSVEIRLGAIARGQLAMHKVGADPYAQASSVFAPPEPRFTLSFNGARRAKLVIDGADHNLSYNIYRDGLPVAEEVGAGSWTDRAAKSGSCYAVEAQFIDSGNRSHHSAAQCAGGGIDIAVTDARVASTATLSGPNARFNAPHLADWGKPADSFTVSGIKLRKAGSYRFQIRYHNAANMINLGISGGVKWLAVKDQAGRVVAQTVVQLPHAKVDKADTPLVYSTPLTAKLKPGSYTLEMSDFYNMSYLRANSSFSAAGGVDGPSNRFDIYGVRILPAH